MKPMLYVCAVGAMIMLTGCSTVRSSLPAYQSVGLNRDLDASALSRYRRGTLALSAERREAHVIDLEHTNKWLLGLLVYWRRGTAQAVRAGSGAETYVVSESLGFGPLAMLLVTKQTATYGGDGQRLAYTFGSSVGWGHLAMLHTMGAQVTEGQWMEHWSGHFLHHLFNIGKEHGRTSFSLCSDPNPMGVGD